MLKKRTHIKLSMLLLAACSSHVNAAELYDISEFELAGVKVGDTLEEAREVLAGYYAISPDDMESRFTDELYDMTGSKNVEYQIYYWGDNRGFDVWFRPTKDYKDKGYMKVSSVNTDPRGVDRNEASEIQKQELEEIIAKYGPPTLEEVERETLWEYYWCSEMDETGTECDLNSPHFSIRNDRTRLVF